MMEDCKTRTPAAQKMYEAECSAALKHARAISDRDRSFDQIDWNKITEDMSDGT